MKDTAHTKSMSAWAWESKRGPEIIYVIYWDTFLLPSTKASAKYPLQKYIL